MKKTVTVQKATLAIFLSVLMLVSVTTPAIALYRDDLGTGTNVDPAANPAFPQQCSLDVILLIDNSGSFTAAELEDVKNATKGFVDDFAAKPYVSSVGVVSFEATATTEIALTDLDTGAAAVKTAIDGIPSNEGEGSTNWEAAFVKASDTYGTADADKPAQLVILISDGQPNVYGDDADGETFSDNVGTAVYEPVEAGTYAANVVKGEGSRVVGILIEDTNQQIDITAAEWAIQNVSGPVEDGPGVSAQETDWFGVDLVDLDAALASIPADVSCSIEVQKTNNADGGEYSDDETASGLDVPVPYQVNVTNTGTIDLTVTEYLDDVYGASIAGLTPSPPVSLPAGDSVVFDFTGSSPVEENGVKVNVFNVTAEDDVANEVQDEDDTTVRSPDLFPEISVEKLVDGDDPDALFSDLEESADGSTVTYQVNVTNVGPNDVTIDEYLDDIYGSSIATLNPALVGTALAPGESIVVTFEGTAPDLEGDSKENTFNVTASDGDGDVAQDEDNATVVARDLTPAISVVKLVDGDDLDSDFSDVEESAPSSTVTYQVNVTNVGPNDVTLDSYVDDIYGSSIATLNPALAGQPLASGDSIVFTFDGTAPDLEGDSKQNTFNVTASDENGDVAQDEDDATIFARDYTPVIQVVKLVDGDDADADFSDVEESAPGSAVTYQVNVTNVGPNDVTLDSYVDDIYGSSIATLNPALAGQPLASGDSIVFTFDGTAPELEGDSKQNTFNVTASDENGDVAQDEDDATIFARDYTPVIEVVKLVDGDDADADFSDVEESAPSSAVTYQVNVTNVGPNDVTIDSYLDDVYGSSIASLNPALVGTELAPGESVVVTFEGTAPDLEGDSKENTFSVTASDENGDLAQAEDNATVLARDYEPQIEVEKLVDGDDPDDVFNFSELASPGSTATYQVTVTNVGPNNVTIDAYLDDVYGSSIASLSPALVGTELAPGDTVTVTFEGSAPDLEGDSKENTFNVTASDENGDLAQDEDNAIIEAIDYTPEIEVVKLVDGDDADSDFSDSEMADFGEQVTYQVTVTNVGPNNVTIDDYVDDVYGTDIVSLNPALVGEFLEPGDSVVVTFTGTAPADDNAMKTNEFTVYAVDIDGDTAVDNDTATIYSRDILPDLTIVKENDADKDGLFSDDELADAPGEVVEFKVTITNNVEENVTIDSIADDIHPINPDFATCDELIGVELAPGETVSCTFFGEITLEYDDVEIDTVTVVGSDDDGNDGSFTDTSTVRTPQEMNICPLTIGYWKTHAGFTGNNPDRVSEFLPIYLGNPSDGDKALEVTNAEMAKDILDMKYGDDAHPKNGITKLYAQFLATKLNLANGASPDASYNGMEFDDAYDDVEEFLATHDQSDWDDLSKSEQQMVNDWAELFDMFNNDKEEGCIDNGGRDYMDEPEEEPEE